MIALVKLDVNEDYEEKDILVEYMVRYYDKKHRDFIDGQSGIEKVHVLPKDMKEIGLDHFTTIGMKGEREILVEAQEDLYEALLNGEFEGKY